MASAFASAAVAAEVLKPRRPLSLLGPKQKLDDIVPRALSGWKSQNVSDLFAPETADGLLERLYADIIGRLYVQDVTGTEILMVMAHGDVQSNALQLHRPEVCYPAYGFEILSNSEVNLTLAPGAILPMRMLVAAQGDAKQTIMYWTRLGEFLPTDDDQQRLDRVKLAIAGRIADGLLARFSMASADSSPGVDVLADFIMRLVKAVARRNLPALIGTHGARALANTS